jgi:hypothetical protein
MRDSRRNFAIYATKKSLTDHGLNTHYYFPHFPRPHKAGFPLGGILRAERNFSLSCDFSGGTN